MNSAIGMILILLVTMFDLSEHLHCYECNINGDTYDKNCETIDEKHKSDYLIKCPETGKKCGTIVTFGRFGEKDITSRGCFDSYEAHRCDELDDPSVSCEACDDDECNDISLTTF